MHSLTEVEYNIIKYFKNVTANLYAVSELKNDVSESPRTS